MMPSYSLRDATRRDVPMLARNRVRMFEDMAAHAGGVFDPTLAARIEAESAATFDAGLGSEHFGWVFEHDGAVVATAMVSIQQWLPHPRYPQGARPYFHSVYTDPAHRGHGLARQLTEHAIGWARARGFLTFVLHASEQGRSIYQRLGFTPANEWILPL